MTPFSSIAAIGDRIGPLAATHIDTAFRAILRDREATVESGFIRLLTGEPHPFGNFVMLRNPADLECAEFSIAPLLTCNAPAAVLTTAPVPTSLATLLSKLGFEPHGGLPGMAVEIDALAPTPLPQGCTFKRIHGYEHRAIWADAFARGYELPLRVGDAFAAAIADDTSDTAPMQYFAIFKDGNPVATSVSFLNEGVAGIYAVATLPEHRGQGLGAYATAQPLRLAHARGYRVGVLQSSEPGHPIYLRLGFKDVSDVPLFVRMPS